MEQQKLIGTSKEHQVDTIAGILKTRMDLDFLLELREKDLEILVACLGDWTHREGR